MSAPAVLHSTASPIIGMLSDPDSSSLDQNHCQLAQNLRFSNGLISTRMGIDFVQIGPAGVTSVVSIYRCLFEGSRLILCVGIVGGVATLFYMYGSGWNGANSSVWHQVLGTYTLSSTGTYSWAMVSDPFAINSSTNGTQPVNPVIQARSKVVLQDGTNQPIVIWNQTGSSAFTAATYNPDYLGINLVSLANSINVQPGLNAVYKGIAGTFSSGGFPEGGTLNPGDGISYPSLTVEAFVTLPATPTTQTVAFTSTTWVGDSYFCVADIDNGVSVNGFFQCVKIEVGDGTNWVTLFDPSQSSAELVFQFVQNTTVATLTNASVAHNTYSSTAFRFTQVVSPPARSPQIGPSASATYAVILVEAGLQGQSQGGASYSVACAQQYGLAESVAAPISVSQTCKPAGDFGMFSTFAPLYTLELNYNTTTVTIATPPGSLPADNQFRLYRQDLGANDYYLVGFSAGSNAFVTDTQPLSPSGIAPLDGAATPMPVSDSMITSGARLLCSPASSNTTTGINPSQVYVSDAYYPARFRLAVRYPDYINPDVNSGTYVQAFGETVTGLLNKQGQLEQVNTIIVFTDQNVYSLNGSDSMSLSRLTLVGRYGSPSGKSAQWAGGVFYIDAYSQIRSLVGGQTVTKYAVQSTIGSVQSSWTLLANNDFIYLLGTGSGGLTTLVYDLILGTFTTDQYAGGIVVTGYIIDAGLGYLTDSLGNIYQQDAVSSPQDTPLSGTATPYQSKLTTRTLISDGWHMMVFNRTGIASTGALPGFTVTRHTRYQRTGSQVVNGSIPAVTGGQSWEAVTGGKPGAMAVGCAIELDVSSSTAWNLTTIVEDVAQTTTEQAP